MAIKFLNTVQVDTDVLYVDTANDRVGIGTDTPLYKLQVQDRIHIEDTTSQQPKISFSENTNTSGEFVLEYNGVGGGSGNYVSFYSEVSGWATKGNGLNYIPQNGYVGIGTTNPNKKIEVSSSTDTTISIASSDTSLNAGQNIGILEFASNNETSLSQAYTPFSKIKGISEIAVTGTASVNGAITFETANANVISEKMRITSSGKVGIGTTNPQADFVVSHQDTSGIEIEANFQMGVNNILSFDRTAGALAYETMRLAAGDFWFTVLGIERMRITSAGNVGIGTTNPNSLLEISKQLSAAGTIDYPYTISSRDDFNSINQVGGEGVGIKFRIAGNDATSPGDSLVGASIAAIRESSTDTDSSTGLGLFVTQNDEILDEAVRIDHDGKVGIGTTSPTADLHIQGSSATDVPVLRVGGFGNSGSKLELAETLTSGAMNYGFSFFNDGNSSNTLIIKAHNNSTAGITAMTIDRGNALTTFGPVPVVGTRAAGDNTTRAASTAFVTAAITAAAPTVNDGTLTMTTATGLDGGATFTANQSGNSEFAVSLDLSELTDMTQTMIGSDEFIVLDNSAERRKAASEIGLSIFNNDAGFTDNVGDITAVVAGTGLTGGGTSGSVTLNVAGGTYTPYNDIRSLGTPAFTNGTNPNITTAQVMDEIDTDGGFDSYSSVFKTSWDYAGNYNLTDAGRFTETAGSSWITWTDNSSDSTRGRVTALAIAPTTGGSAGKVFIYNDQGSGYAPGWREVWTNTSDGAGSGLDADLLDGQQGSYYAPASGGNYWPTSGSWWGANMPGSRARGTADSGGEIVVIKNNPSNGRSSILVDGQFYAGENGGFYSLYSGNNYNNKVGFYGNSSGDFYITTTNVKANGNTMWHAGNDGSGSGLDADTVDGLHANRLVSGGSSRKSTQVSSFAGSNEVTGAYFGNNVSGAPTTDWINYINTAGNSWANSNNYAMQLTHAFHSDNLWVSRTTNGTNSTARLIMDSGNIGTQTVANATNCLPLAGGAMTGNIQMNNQIFATAGNYGRGVFGLYNSGRYQHVWSMGTAYKLADDGTTTGNLYGLAYTHTNAGGQSKPGLSHQLLIMNSGVTKSAIGTGIWTTGNITTEGEIYIPNKIIHTGDTDTYLQFHAANQFRVVTGGTEMLEVNDTYVQLGADLNANNKNLINVEDIGLNDRIYHDGDTDTYMQFHAANEWRVVTGGTEMLEVTSNNVIVHSNAILKGKVYINASASIPTRTEEFQVTGRQIITNTGTDGPSLDLGYNSSGSARVQLGRGRTADGLAYIDFNGEVMSAGEYGFRIMRNSGANAVTLLNQIGTGNLQINASNGADTVFTNTNVGIGTTSPASLLEVQGAAPYIYITDTTETDSGIIFRDLQAGLSQAAAIKFNSSNNKLQFYNNDTTAVRMTIDTAGNVGVGVTSPGSKLEVGGNALVDGVFTIEGPNPQATAPMFKLRRTTPTVDYDDLNSAGYLHVKERFKNSSGTVIASREVWQNPGGSGLYYNFDNGGSGGSQHRQKQNSFHWTINSNSEKLTIGTNGYLGVNDTSPSYQLDVNGNGRFTSTVTATNFILSSDERLKENIEKVCNNKIKVDWKTFELKADKGQKRYGVIAQELEKTNPEFVREEVGGFKSVAYIDLLIAKIAELEARLEKLEK